MKYDEFVQFDHTFPMIKGHTSQIIDFQFNPFIDNFIATASEDGTVALWTIPADGLTEDLRTPLAMMYGHSKKLTHLTFNPSAENVLATTSFDKDIRIWDVYRAKEHLTVSGLIGQPTALEWNHDGSLLAALDKSKNLTVVDPRNAATALLAESAHKGQKQMKCCWLGESNKIFTSGVNQNMFKEFCVWDSRDISEPLIRKAVDKTTDVSDPFYDPFTKILYLSVKGDSRVNFWKLTDSEDSIVQLGFWKGDGHHRGFNFLPKRFVDVMSSEIMRGVRLTEKF